MERCDDNETIRNEFVRIVCWEDCVSETEMSGLYPLNGSQVRSC